MQVAPADVHDEGHRRLERGDIRKVLFRADADVDAAAFRGREQVGDDELQPRLVRQEVVGSEAAARFGQVGDERPEFLIAQPRREMVGYGRTRAVPPQPGKAGEENRAAANSTRRLNIGSSLLPGARRTRGCVMMTIFQYDVA